MNLLSRLPFIGGRNGTHEEAAPVVDDEVHARLGPSLSDLFEIEMVAEDYILTRGQQKIVVFETRGNEITAPILGAYAGALNALEFGIQILIRQHPPRLGPMRREMRENRAQDLTESLVGAAESLDTMLDTIEKSRDMAMDRRFYVLCEEKNVEDLAAVLTHAQLDYYRMGGEVLRDFVFGAALGITSDDMDPEGVVDVEINRRYIRMGDNAVRQTFNLRQWPRAVSVHLIGSLLQTGIAMDLSIHVHSISPNAAASHLEWQRVRLQSAATMSIKRSGSVSSATELGLEDVMRLRDLVQRGAERLFSVGFYVTIHAEDEDGLNSARTAMANHFNASLGRLDEMRYRQKQGAITTMPLARNAGGGWRMVDTSSLVVVYPFSPPDLDTRYGTVIGYDMRARSLISYDAYDGTWVNANTTVLARSGGGKSFSTKLAIVRNLTRDIRTYVIDPEGEYVDLARYAGGRVIVPGMPGQGLNPFSIQESDVEEYYARIASLRRLIEVMVGERLNAEHRALLDMCLSLYYKKFKENQSFHHFHEYLTSDEAPDGARWFATLLSPFSSGTLSNLMSDHGEDILANEKNITVFDLHMVEPDMRPAAAMVCTETVWSLAMQDQRPRQLTVDEVWSIIQHPEGSAFMVNLAKRARKYKLGLLSITQDVQDLLMTDESAGIKGNAGRALLQSSAFKLLLQQDPAAARAVGDAFDLDEDTTRWLTTCPRGQGLLISERGKFPIRIDATPEETEIIEWRGRSALVS